MVQVEQVQKPQVVTKEQVAAELNLNQNDLQYVDIAGSEVLDIDPEIVKEVQPQVDKFFSVLMDKTTDAGEKTDYVYSIGKKVAERKNDFLDRQMKELMSGEGNDNLAQGLLDLRDQIAELDPNLYFGQGSFSRVARKLARNNKFLKKLIRNYVDKYTSAETVIYEILHGLQSGQATLERNNLTLAGEKKQMRLDVELLKKAIAFAQMLDKKIEAAIAEATDAEWKQILSEEILFPLRQRINTLQKTRVVKNQSILNFEMIIRTNRQLINGIKNSDQAIEILKVAITTSLALKDAEKVNKAIQAIDELSGNMLVQNSERLSTVVMEVYKHAAQAGIPIEKLVIAQKNALSTLENYSNFIQEQLPKMKAESAQVEALNKEIQDANDKMERGSKIGEKIAESMKDLF